MMNDRPMTHVRDLAVFAGVFVALASGGCSSSSSGAGETSPAPPGESDAAADSGPAAASAPIIGCSNEGQTYTANMEQAGKNGKYTFTLVSASPAPPYLDANVWTVNIVDSAGKSPAVTQLSALPFMPKMGHGSSQVPQFAANPDGTFTVSDVYLFMDGLWTVTFSVLAPETDGGAKPLPLDSAVYTFCING